MPPTTLLAGADSPYDARLQYESDPAYNIAASRCFGVVPQVDMSKFMDNSREGIHLYASALSGVLEHYTADVIRDDKYARAEFFVSVVWISCNEPTGQLLRSLHMPWLQGLLELVKRARKGGKNISYLVDMEVSKGEEEYETDEGDYNVDEEGSMSLKEENEHRPKRAKHSRPQQQDEECEEEDLVELEEKVKNDDMEDSDVLKDEAKDEDWDDEEETIAAPTRNKPRAKKTNKKTNKRTTSARPSRQIPTKGHQAPNACVRCRCRRQKCTRGLPKCARCAKLGKPCVYGGTVEQARQNVRAYHRSK